jgi:uncharacterized membrane protein YfcA
LGLALLFVAGFVASSINAFAGGGSLISFPMLVGLGLPTLPANATNSVALWPGSLSSAFAFKDYWQDIKEELKLMAPVTLLGSGLGAWLLTRTPARAFDVAVPVLILLATLLLAFQKQVKSLGAGKKLPAWGAASLQFLVALYGGYFGAGMGILMLAVLGVHAEGDIHRHNAVKNLLAVLINVVSSAILLAQGLVVIVAAAAMIAGAILGGFTSGRLSQKVPADGLRMAIVVFGAVMTVVFGLRALG